MSKVKVSFFCNESKKIYKVGSDYKGNRKDLDHLLEDVKPVEKVKILKNKNLKK